MTVGAIQSRYKSKGELFADVLKPLLADIETAFAEIKRVITLLLGRIF